MKHVRIYTIQIWRPIPTMTNLESLSPLRLCFCFAECSLFLNVDGGSREKDTTRRDHDVYLLTTPYYLWVVFPPVGPSDAFSWLSPSHTSHALPLITFSVVWRVAHPRRRLCCFEAPVTLSPFQSFTHYLTRRRLASCSWYPFVFESIIACPCHF